MLEGLRLGRFVFTTHLWIVSWRIQTFSHKVLVSMSREARLWARDDIQSWLKPCRTLWVRESSPGSAPTFVTGEVRAHEARHALSMQGMASNKRSCLLAVV